MRADQEPATAGPTANRLADATSPYLLQHAANPVCWQPWDEASLGQAIREDKPIFLSVGYSACHWCHVMAHESFEDPVTAEVLNAHFVNIKVDREERPDIDSVYMTAVQLLTGRGGWPMSVFLTPKLEPFFAGTYWPPEPRMGMPGFRQVLAAVIEAWTQRREAVVRQADALTAALARPPAAAASPAALSEDLLDSAVAGLGRSYDRRHGGFGAAPKFPHPMDLRLLLRTFARSGRQADLEMATHTLRCMAAGGIHDHLGGGFARYSVDDRWLVPHFEKMLYDNALLATAYLEAWLVSGAESFAATCRGILDYLLRDMTDPEGGLWSAEDADSEGEEGRFYVWSPAEIEAVLGPDEARLFCEAFGVTPSGNFEGRSILNLPQSIERLSASRGIVAAELSHRLAGAREKLLAIRAKRVRPGIDDKVLVAWNGLAIDSLARAGAGFEEPRYVEAARRAADFLLAECRDAEGRLAHQWRRGRASGLAFADDLACLANGLVSLYEATFDERWIAAACDLADRLLAFVDPEGGGFHQTSPEHERLIVRRTDLTDNATPGATGMAATTLARLAAFTGRNAYRAAAERAVAAVADFALQAPAAVPQSLLAVDWLLGPLEECVIVGDAGREPLLRAIRGRFRPRSLTVARNPAEAAVAPGSPRPLDHLFLDRTGSAEAVTLYRCVGATCQPPLRDDAALTAMTTG